MPFTRLRTLLRRTWWRLLTLYYSRKFGCVGRRLLVKGVCRVRNAGTIVIGDDCIIDSSWARPVRIEVGKEAILRIGSKVYLNEGVSITCHVGIDIGDRCLIATDVVILDDDGHPLDCRRRHDYQPDGPKTRIGAPVVLEDNVWIATRAILLKGVRIGAGSVVGAGAVVTRSVPTQTLAVGIAAEARHALPQ